MKEKKKRAGRRLAQPFVCVQVTGKGKTEKEDFFGDNPYHGLGLMEKWAVDALSFFEHGLPVDNALPSNGGFIYWPMVAMLSISLCERPLKPETPEGSPTPKKSLVNPSFLPSSSLPEPSIPPNASSNCPKPAPGNAFIISCTVGASTAGLGLTAAEDPGASCQDLSPSPKPELGGGIAEEMWVEARRVDEGLLTVAPI